MRRYFLCGVLFLSMCLAASGAQVKEDVNPQEKADMLERLAKQTTNLEEFGQAVLSQALLAAAQQQKEGKITGDEIRVQLPITVREIRPAQRQPPPSPDISDPSSIDVCWETTVGISSYLDCSNPYQGLQGDRYGVLQKRKCDALRAQLLETLDDLAWIKVWSQLVRAGCIDVPSSSRGVILLQYN